MRFYDNLNYLPISDDRTKSVAERSEILGRLVLEKHRPKVMAELGTLLETCLIESDRGALMVVQSTLDRLLGELFTLIFVEATPDIRPQELKWLLRGSLAPLGGFFRRVQMAHAMGLIDRDLKKILEELNDLRVDPAHSPGVFSIDQDAVKRLQERLEAKTGRSLQSTETFTQDCRDRWHKNMGHSPEVRAQFVTCAVTCFLTLKYRVLDTAVIGWHTPARYPKDILERMEIYAGSYVPPSHHQPPTAPAQRRESPPPAETPVQDAPSNSQPLNLQSEPKPFGESPPE